jgi:hypothetical protein
MPSLFGAHQLSKREVTGTKEYIETSKLLDRPGLDSVNST